MSLTPRNGHHDCWGTVSLHFQARLRMYLYTGQLHLGGKREVLLLNRCSNICRSICVEAESSEGSLWQLFSHCLSPQTHTLYLLCDAGAGTVWWDHVAALLAGCASRGCQEETERQKEKGTCFSASCCLFVVFQFAPCLAEGCSQPQQFLSLVKAESNWQFLQRLQNQLHMTPSETPTLVGEQILFTGVS